MSLTSTQPRSPAALREARDKAAEDEAAQRRLFDQVNYEYGALAAEAALDAIAGKPDAANSARSNALRRLAERRRAHAEQADQLRAAIDALDQELAVGEAADARAARQVQIDAYNAIGAKMLAASEHGEAAFVAFAAAVLELGELQQQLQVAGQRLGVDLDRFTGEWSETSLAGLAAMYRRRMTALGIALHLRVMADHQGDTRTLPEQMAAALQRVAVDK